MRSAESRGAPFIISNPFQGALAGKPGYLRPQIKHLPTANCRKMIRPRSYHTPADKERWPWQRVFTVAVPCTPFLAPLDTRDEFVPHMQICLYSYVKIRSRSNAINPRLRPLLGICLVKKTQRYLGS